MMYAHLTSKLSLPKSTAMLFFRIAKQVLRKRFGKRR